MKFYVLAVLIATIVKNVVLFNFLIYLELKLTMPVKQTNKEIYTFDMLNNLDTINRCRCWLCENRDEIDRIYLCEICKGSITRMNHKLCRKCSGACCEILNRDDESDKKIAYETIYRSLHKYFADHALSICPFVIQRIFIKDHGNKLLQIEITREKNEKFDYVFSDSF